MKDLPIRIIATKPGEPNWLYFKLRAIYFFRDLFNAPPYSQNYSFEDMAELIKKNSQSTDYRLYVATHNTRIVGMFESMRIPDIIDEQNIARMDTSLLPISQENNHYYIFQMGVLPHYRRHHIGEHMFQAMLCGAKKMGYDDIILWSDANSQAGQKFWRHNGFEELPKPENFPTNCIFLSRQIQKTLP